MSKCLKIIYLFQKSCRRPWTSIGRHLFLFKCNLCGITVPLLYPCSLKFLHHVMFLNLLNDILNLFYIDNIDEYGKNSFAFFCVQLLIQRANKQLGHLTQKSITKSTGRFLQSFLQLFVKKLQSIKYHS